MKVKVFALISCLLAMILMFSGCIRDRGTSSTTNSSLTSQGSISQSIDSKVNGSATSNDQSSKGKTTKPSTSTSTNYDEIQKQLDELEDVLNSLDSYSEGDMQIPSS